MKLRILSCFLAVFILFSALILVSSCGTTQEIENDAGLLNTENQEVPQENLNSEKNVEVEIEPIYSTSVDELISTIKNIKQGKTADINNASTLDSLIVPDFTIDGYHLFGVEVTKTSIIYYYSPLSVSRANGFIDRNRDYVVTVRRPEYVNGNDPLQPLINQLHIAPNEDGYLYDREKRNVTFAYENVWVSISVPKSVTDYEKIKPLCKVKSVKID